MLLVQQYLKNHTFGDLQREHGVYASFNKTGQYFSLNYDMIEAKNDDLLSQECRGLILSKINGSSFLPEAKQDGAKIIYNHLCPGNTRVLCFGMKRFFNYGQDSCASINWSDPNLKVLEKLDGTLCQVWYNPFSDQWNVATRSCPEADLLMDNGLFTFRTLFEKALKDTTFLTFEQFTSKLDPDLTYCFELTTPYNRIVVNYPNNGITLLAVRSLITLKEFDPHEATEGEEFAGIPVIQAHTYTTLDELLNWVSSLNPMEHEGVVVRDSQFNRIKIKNAQYVAYNKVRDALATSPRNIVELILAERDDDIIPFLPEEIVKNLQKIKTALQQALQYHDTAYHLAKATVAPGDKKSFALLVTQNKQVWTAPLFSMFDGKSTNMKDFILKNRKDGTWGNSFLDKLLEMSKRFSA